MALHWSDYFIFALSLVVYAALGIYYRWPKQIKHFICRCCHKKGDGEVIVDNQTTEDIFLGGRSMGVFPIMASTAASFFSAATLLGNHAETYLYGLPVSLSILTNFVDKPLVAELYMPVIYKLNLKSFHQYFEMRFGIIAKILVTIIFLIQMIFYVGASLFAPSIGLAAATGINVNIIIVLAGALATFYTALGGLKAVVWTDVVQLVIMIIGLIIILVFGVNAVGGPAAVWQIALRDGRIDKINLSADIFVRYTLLSLVFGSIGNTLTTLASNQTLVQRYMACKSLKTAKRAIYLNIPLSVCLTTLQVMIAIVSYAYFAGCDPVASGKIERHDTIFAYLVIRLFANTPVFTGLFISVIFAAALSTISSGLNSLAFVSVVDIFLPIHKKRVPDSKISEKRMALISRLVAVAMGFLAILVAVVLSFAPVNILRIIISIFAVTGGAILVLLTLGIFFPFINKWGGLCGLISSFVGTLWVAVGGLVRNNIADILGKRPTNESCPVTAQTMQLMSQAVTEAPKPKDFSFYDLSFLWLTSFALIIGFITASIVSLATGMNSKKPIPQSLLAKQAVTVYRRIPWCVPPQSYEDNSPFVDDEDEKSQSISAIMEISVDDSFPSKF